MKHYTLQNLQYVQYSLRYSPDYNSKPCTQRYDIWASQWVTGGRGGNIAFTAIICCRTSAYLWFLVRGAKLSCISGPCRRKQVIFSRSNRTWSIFSPAPSSWPSHHRGKLIQQLFQHPAGRTPGRLQSRISQSLHLKTCCKITARKSKTETIQSTIQYCMQFLLSESTMFRKHAKICI